MNTGGTWRRGRRYFDKGPRGCVVGLFCVIAILLGIPVLAFITERILQNQLEAFAEIEDNILDLVNSKEGDLVHFAASDLKATAEDEPFGVTMSGGLQLKRKTEYCQWREFEEQRCQKCSETVAAKDGSSTTETHDCDCETEYYYTKAWRSHRTNSMLFDQNVAHHNPQRDPYPSRVYTAERALGEALHQGSGSVVDIGSDILANTRAPFKHVDWTLGAKPSPPTWRQSLFGMEDRTRYESIESLRGAELAEAASKHRFYFVVSVCIPPELSFAGR